MKKLISVALSAAMLLSCLLSAMVPVSAEENYTAADLVNKTTQEIIEIIGEDFEVEQGVSMTVCFYNYNVIPGMKFNTELSFPNNAFDNNGNILPSVAEDLKSSIKSSKDNLLTSIILSDKASLDDNISADMTYNQLTQYLGDFSCIFGTGVDYPLYNQNNDLVATFSFEKDNLIDILTQPNCSGVNAEDMKSADPKLEKITVYPGYEATYTNDDTDSEEPTTKIYTAAELVNMTVPEILEITGGYQYGTVYEGTSQAPEDGLFAFCDPEKLPGFVFVLDGLTTTEFYADRKKVTADIAKGKYGLKFISIINSNISTKLDDNISADMSYNDLTKYLGEFECVVASAGRSDISYTFTSANDVGKAVFFFKDGDIDLSKAVGGKFTSDILKSVNPQIEEILVYPGYESTYLNNDTNSDSDSDTDSEAEIIGFELEYGVGCDTTTTMTVFCAKETENPNFVVKSSNESVATATVTPVSKGGMVTVKAASGGTTTLTLTETVTGATATCDVRVFNGSDFTLGEDNLSFANSSDNYYNGEALTILKHIQGSNNGTYEWGFLDNLLYGDKDSYTKQRSIVSHQISDEVYQRLLGHTTNSSEQQRIEDFYNSVWGGSCYGMCAVMDIMFADSSSLPISRIFDGYNDSTRVNDLPKPVDSSNMEDLVTYYHLTQKLNFSYNSHIEFEEEIESNYNIALENLVNSIDNTSTPVFACIQILVDNGEGLASDGGHSILLLRIKDETAEYYTVECYDPNSVNCFTELKLYKKNSGYNAMNNNFNISYGSYNSLYSYFDSVDDIDQCNFFSTETLDSELIKDMIVMTGENNFTITANNKTLIENGSTKDDSVLGPVPTSVGAVADSDVESVSEVTYFVDKGISDEYTVTCEESDSYGKAEITLDDHMFSITAKDSGEATFNDETGAMSVEMDKESDYIVRVTDNNNICNWDWFTLTVAADDSKNLDVQFTEEGVLIDGDNLKGTEVTVNNISDSKELTIDENLTSVMIKKSGNEITATEVEKSSSTGESTATTATNKNQTSTSTTQTTNDVATSDVTNILVVVTIFALSIVAFAVSVKCRKNN